MDEYQGEPLKWFRPLRLKIADFFFKPSLSVAAACGCVLVGFLIGHYAL